MIYLNKSIYLSLLSFFIFFSSFVCSQQDKRKIQKTDLLGTWKLLSEDQCDECPPLVLNEDKFLTFRSNGTCEGVLLTSSRFQNGNWELNDKEITIIIQEEENKSMLRKYTVQFYDNKFYLTYQAYYGSANRIFIFKNKN